MSRCDTLRLLGAGEKDPPSLRCCRGNRGEEAPFRSEGRIAGLEQPLPPPKLLLQASLRQYCSGFGQFSFFLHQLCPAGKSSCVPAASLLQRMLECPRNKLQRLADPRAGSGLQGTHLSPPSTTACKYWLARTLKKKKAEFQYIPLHHIASD